MPNACKVPTSGWDSGKYNLPKTSPVIAHRAENHILDYRTDRAGDHGAAQLNALLKFGQALTCVSRNGHGISFPIIAYPRLGRELMKVVSEWLSAKSSPST